MNNKKKNEEEIEIIEVSEEKLREIDKPTGRQLTGVMWYLVSIIALSASVYHLFIMFAYPIDPFLFRAVHLGFIMVLGFLLTPAAKNSPLDRFTILDVILALLSIGIVVYIFNQFSGLVFRQGAMPTTTDVYIGTLAIILLIELSRRMLGWTMPILALAFYAYSLFGQALPGFLGHPGYSYARVVSNALGTSGIYTIPLGVSATYVFLFILFGAFLQVSGAGITIIDGAKAIAGGTRGGPAKTAVFASALMGTISGASIANVAVTGTFTIPLMRKTGYDKTFASAVEAVASTGGQVTPPVMGAAVFILAEILGRPYSEIMIAGIIPAFLYYVGVFSMVDFEAVKKNLSGLPKRLLPNIKKVISERGHLLLPLLVLIFFLVVLKVSPIRAAIMAILSTVIVSFFRRNTWMTPNKIIESLVLGPQKLLTVATTCGVAGLIIGVVLQTGLGHRFSTMMIRMTGGNILAALIMAMIVALILGMGVPPVAAYAIAGTMVAPALIRLGVHPLSAHMFVFFFCAIAPITPPVAFAAYAAAAIGEADMWKVGMQAFKIGAAAYLVPYLFVYSPTLLLEGQPIRIILSVITAIIGVVFLAGAIQGWFIKFLSYPLRLLLLIASLSMVIPNIRFALPGIIAFGIFIILVKKNIGAREKLSTKTN